VWRPSHVSTETAETVANKKCEKGNFAGASPVGFAQDGDSLSATTIPNAADD
jgi:hypothetical protein